jgi:hypothetical protein
LGGVACNGSSAFKHPFSCQQVQPDNGSTCCNTEGINKCEEGTRITASSCPSDFTCVNGLTACLVGQDQEGNCYSSSNAKYTLSDCVAGGNCSIFNCNTTNPVEKNCSGKRTVTCTDCTTTSS